MHRSHIEICFTTAAMLMAGDCANIDACIIQLCSMKLCLHCLLLSCSVADAVGYGDATATLAKQHHTMAVQYSGGMR